MKIRSLLLALALFVSPFFLAGQTSDVTVWITASEFNDSTISEDGETAELEFEEEAGYGVSFNHFWTNAFSTEFAFHRFDGDLSVSVDDEIPFDAGEIEARSLSGVAQWHFRRATRFSPYIGAGVAYMQGDFNVADEEETLEFAPETTWVINFGANIAITQRFAIALDAKHMRWEPKEEDDEATDRIDVSPTLLSAGLRYRF